MSYKKSLEESVKASKAEYKQLGKCGLRISVPILGAMSFGDPEWQSWVLDEEKSLPLLKAAYDRGLNTWDTADIYSNGASEKIIAKALKKYSIPRHKIIILSKCFAYIGEEHASCPPICCFRVILTQFTVFSERQGDAIDERLRQPWRSLSPGHLPSCRSKLGKARYAVYRCAPDP